MDRATREFVRHRAGLRCEYCQLSELFSPLAKLQVEHVRPIKHGGTDDVENLALACIDCNLRKGPNLSGIDPDTDAIEPLFHPLAALGRSLSLGERTDRRHERFRTRDSGGDGV